ncbi:MAG: PLP-dependent aminotransferase family protein [Actinomycetota bacterium]
MSNRFDPYSDRYALRAAGMTGSEIRALFSVLDRPEIISLAGGNTETDIVAHRVVDCVRAVIERDSRGALGYGAAGGHLVLRERLVDLMAQQGIEAEPHQVVVTNGAQQALEFMAKVFCEPGDLVLTEAPTYVGAIGAFSSFQAELRSVATDEHGIIPEALDEMLGALAAEGRRAKFLYLVPTFQNPSGYTLTAERRPAVVEICRSRDVLIVEDDPYAPIRFEGTPVPPLRALTDAGIIYLGTLSKVFSPGIRTGWVLAPEPVRERLVLAKEAADLCSSPFTQLVAAEYLSSPHLEEDLEIVRKVYKERRDAMLDAIDEHFPSGVRVGVPEGGLFLWVTLPEPIDTKAMLARALEAGVAYVPGTAFYPRKRDGRASMRLNFSYAPVADIEEGIRRLGSVVGDELELARSLQG